MKSILLMTSEASPFYKTGGLADVALDILMNVKNKRYDIRLIMPLYKSIKIHYREKLKVIDEISIYQKREITGKVYILEYKGISCYFIESQGRRFSNNDYQDYYHGLNTELFLVFNQLVFEFLKKGIFKPEIIHLNDWHCGYIPYLIKNSDLSIKSLMTLHNLKYQGAFDFNKHKSLQLNQPTILKDRKESLLSLGIHYTDLVNTVSNVYRMEVLSGRFDFGLQELLGQYKYKFTSVTNGIDYKRYNPENDAFIYKHYNSNTFIDGKSLNKKYLQKTLGLNQSKDVLLIGVVSRLTEMKGLGIIKQIFEEVATLPIQFVLLGKGSPNIENDFRDLELKYPNKVRVNILFSKEFARKIYAGADVLLMPSKFEPCGLSQLIALRYGTIPIVHSTGGLKETVQPYGKSSESTGFHFQNFKPSDLLGALNDALSLYQKKHQWHELVKRAMLSDHSFEQSAEDYIRLYQKLSERI